MSDLIINRKPIKFSGQSLIYKHTGLHFPASWKGCEKRSQKITHIVLHWTGGEGHGGRVYNVLKNRGLAVEFFIDSDGVVFQYADPGQVACRATGNNFWKRSISIEIQNYGFRKHPEQIPEIGRERSVYIDKIHGHAIKMADFFTVQAGSIYTLTKLLCSEFKIPFTCPVNSDGSLIRRRLKNEERDEVGVLGHFHLTTRKSDPGTKLFNDLFEAF